MAETADGWAETLPHYIDNPALYVRDVLRLGRHGVEGMPAPVRVALADAHMRAGHLRTAERLFDSVIDEAPGEPWWGFAALGRGWVSVLRSDVDDARERFRRAAATPGRNGLVAEFMVGMLAAAAGDMGEAFDRFRHVAENANDEPPDPLRVSALTAEGYARYWFGDDAGASTAFARVLEEAPAGPLADDARYGDTLIRWRAGDRSGAEESLRELVGVNVPDSRTRRTPSGLINLDPRALVRASARRYRALPLRLPADQVLAMLDTDARVPARMSLRRLQAGATPSSNVAPAGFAGAHADATASGKRGPGTGRQSIEPHVHPTGATSTRLSWIVAFVLTLVAIGIGWRLRQRAA